MPQLIRLTPGQVTILPGTPYLLWARFGPVNVKLYSDEWYIDAPDAYDGQQLALFIDAGHIEWRSLVARNGRGSPS